MAKLNDLQLGTEKIGDADFDQIPEQMGGYRPDPQPGTYRFALPKKLDAVWDTLEIKDKGTRINAIFDDANPLVIVQSPGGVLDGEPFQTRISNNERKRGKRDDPAAVEASDMDYLLRDGLGETAKPKTNAEYAKALMKHAGEQFTADIERSWYCNPKKTIRTASDDGRSVEVEGQVGCGARYYQKDVEKVPSDPADPTSVKVFPERITCGGCGAEIRGFSNLVRFRK